MSNAAIQAGPTFLPNSGRWGGMIDKVSKAGAVLLLGVAGLVVIFDLSIILAGLLTPLAWIGSIWSGDSSIAMRDQMPIIGETNGFAMAGLSMFLLAFATLASGLAFNRNKLATRFAMAFTGVGAYLLLLATPLPYVVTRSIFSALALSFIFGARLIRKVRPAKTILFFVGVGFTCEALAWSLADPTATLTGFSIFTLTAIFFTKQDKKRVFKTTAFAFSGFAVFTAATLVLLDVSLIAIAIALVAIAYVAHLRLTAIAGVAKERRQDFDGNPEGLSSLTFPHIETLGQGGSRIVYHAPELKVVKDPNTGLDMFKIASVFTDRSSVLIGCGTPNLATSVYDATAGTWKRLSAFMLYREASHISELDSLQVGVYFEVRGLDEEARRRVLNAMVDRAGVRAPSCAFLNARVLQAAGFSLGGGRSMTRLIRPSRLARLIWRFGLEHDGKPVTLRVVNTSPLEVGDHFVGVWRKEANSPIRLVHKALKGKKTKVAFTPELEQLVASRSHDWDGRPVSVWMTRPRRLGAMLMLLWGRHAEFKVAVDGFQQLPQLMEPLTAFPGQLSFVSKAKKHVLFSKPVVAFINHIKNKSYDRYDNVPIDAALEMLSPTSIDFEKRTLWNFALVVARDSYEVKLSPLKNLDPLSRDSKLRQVSNWILAKHVVATGYSTATVYAGEAWVQKHDGDEDVTLYVNNNSGTYKPTTEQLDAVGQAFASLGINVQTVIHQFASA